MSSSLPLLSTLMTWSALALPLASYRLAQNFRVSIGQSGFNQPVLKLYRHLELAQGLLRGSDGISVTHATLRHCSWYRGSRNLAATTSPFSNPPLPFSLLISLQPLHHRLPFHTIHPRFAHLTTLLLPPKPKLLQTLLRIPRQTRIRSAMR